MVKIQVEMSHRVSSALRVELCGVPNVFSRRTLGEFEDASASVPLRRIDRVFDGADIRLGDDPGGTGGDRRMQFRRYIASVDQHDLQQLDRLGDALGALIAEVATSKQDFLVKAAERDGFFFADGVFRPAKTAPGFFAVTRVEDLAFIDDRGRRLHLIANDRAKDAIEGAAELIESVCRTVLHLSGKPAPGKTANLTDIAASTFKALEHVAEGVDDARSAALVQRCLRELSAVVASVDEMRNVRDSGHERDGKPSSLSTRSARLAVGAAVTVAGFVAESYIERAAAKNVAKSKL